MSVRGGHHRQIRAAERRILDEVERTGRVDLASHPDTTAVFGGLAPLLRYLHGRWVLHIGAALDDEGGGIASADDFDDAWERVTRRHPALAEVLAAHALHPVVRHGRQRHTRLLAAAGLAVRLPAWNSPRVMTGAPTLEEGR